MKLCRKFFFYQCVFLLTGILSTLGNQIVYYHGAGDNASLLPAAATFIGKLCSMYLPETREYTHYVLPYSKLILMGFLEFFGCVFAMVGLNFAGSGIFQIVYASIVIWIALLARWFLNKKMSPHHWTAVIITTVGVSLSAVGTFSLNSFNTLQFFGILLTLLSTFSYGANYIVSEAIISGIYPPPSSVIQLYTGITGFLLVLIYLAVYTVPNWDSVVSSKIEAASGNIAIIICTYLILILSSCLHSWSYLKLLKQTGSVSTSILQSLRASCVFILSSILFCDSYPEQCITIPKIASAIVVIFGVSCFSVLNYKQEHFPKVAKNQPIHV